MKLISPQAEKQKIEIRVELPDGPSVIIDADRGRLEQVLLNLLVNAMESMPLGGTLTVRLSVTGTPEATVRLEVIDTGRGIPKSIQDRIFDPYFTTKNDGTGMGLALCDKIVRQHEGRLGFHSTSQGTVFEMTLPIELGSERAGQETL